MFYKQCCEFMTFWCGSGLGYLDVTLHSSTTINLVKNRLDNAKQKKNLPDGEAPPAYLSPYPPFGRV